MPATTTTAPTTTTTAPPTGGWPSPWQVSADDAAPNDSAKVAVDRQGDALLVWSASDPSSQYHYPRIYARRQPTGGAPEPIVALSASGPWATFPEVDSDDDGNAAVVWDEGQVMGRRVSASGAPVGDVQTISSSDAPASGARVAVAPGGEALVMWTEIRDGAFSVHVRQFGVDGSLGPILTLGDAAGDSFPALGVDRDGRFVVAWAQASQVSAARIEAGAVTSSVVLTTGLPHPRYGNPQVGVDADGDAVISYLASGAGPPQVWVSRWSRTGTLADPLLVSPDGAWLLHAVGTDLEGDSVLVWTRQAGPNVTDMFGRPLSRDGTLGAVTNLGQHDRPSVALDDDGDGLVVSGYPAYPNESEVTAHPIGADGSFGSPVTLSPDARAAAVGASPDGRFTVMWQQASHPYPVYAVTGP